MSERAATWIDALRDRSNLGLVLVALVLAELIAFLLAVKPAAAVAIGGSLFLAGVLVHVRRPAVLWLALLPVLPILNFVLYSRTGLGVALATAGALALAWVASLITHFGEGPSIRLSDLAFVLFGAMVLASTLFAGGEDAPRLLVGSIGCGLAGYFVLRRVFAHESAPIRGCWWAFLLVTALLSLSGLVEAYSSTDLFSYSEGVLPVSGVEGISRINGPFPTDIEFGLSLVMCLAVVLAGWTGAAWETTGTRWAAAIVATLAVLAVYFTYFRTTWLVVLVLVFVWLVRRGATMLAVLAVVGTVSLAALSGATSKLTQSSFVETRVLSSENVSGRLATNQKAIEIFRERPLVGIGWANFASDPRSVVISGVGDIDTPHNAYLGVLAELGLLGFALFTWMWLAVVREAQRFRRTAREHPEARSLALGAWWAILLFLVFSVDFQTLTLPFAVLLFLGAGGLAAGLRTRLLAQQ